MHPKVVCFLFANSAVKGCFLLLVTGYLSLSSSAATAIPSWWITRGVINTNLAPHNYGPVNQGQLKHIATQAYLELEAKLPNGGGDTILV